MTAKVPQVGAPDPALDTSPIVDEAEEYDELAPDVDFEAGACYFNGVRYAFGEFVLSGSELLRAEKPGVWVRAGEMRPD
ncbi:MAG: hypothetical protein N2544_13140 [Burkholderiales bacterium]|nr:hypothetical protein [Burkholderiales bacterium]